MSVALIYLPAEGAELLPHVSQIHHICGKAVQLLTVHIDNGDQIGQPVLVGEEEAFPVLPLVQLAVPDDHPCGAVPAVHPVAKGYAAGAADALTEAAGGHIDPRSFVPVRMAGETAAALVQLPKHTLREKALHGQGGVNGGARMAFGDHQLVPIGPVGTFGVIAHEFPVEQTDRFHDAHGAADMAEADVTKGGKGLHPDLFRKNAEFLTANTLIQCFYSLFKRRSFLRYKLPEIRSAGGPEPCCPARGRLRIRRFRCQNHR